MGKKEHGPYYVPIGERLAYTVGDYGTNAYLQFVSMYLLFFYTDYMGISPVWAGAIMLVSRLWDGVNDLIIGYLADRTGNYKKWMFFGALLSMFTFAIMFIDWGFGTVGKIVYGFVTFSLWTFTYTMLGTPVNAMASTITPDDVERARVNNVRFPLVVIPTLLATVLTLPLAAKFGAMTGSPTFGFAITAFCFGFVGWLLVLVCIKFVKERAPMKPKTKEEAKQFTIGTAIGAFKGNRPAIIMMLTFFLAYLAYYITGNCTTYYCTYVLNDTNVINYYGYCSGAISLVSMAIAPRLFMKKGIRWTALFAQVLIIISLLVRFFVRTSSAVFLIGATVQNGCLGIMTVVCFTMVGDVVSYTRWKGNDKSVAVFYSAGIFTQKVAMAFAAFFGGAFLTFFGYVANQAQTETALFGIVFTYCIIPAVFTVILMLIVRKWDLDTHESVGYLLRNKKNKELSE